VQPHAARRSQKRRRNGGGSAEASAASHKSEATGEGGGWRNAEISKSLFNLILLAG